MENTKETSWREVARVKREVNKENTKETSTCEHQEAWREAARAKREGK